MQHADWSSKTMPYWANTIGIVLGSINSTLSDNETYTLCINCRKLNAGKLVGTGLLNNFPAKCTAGPGQKEGPRHQRRSAWVTDPAT